jgi:hypothetical protein
MDALDLTFAWPVKPPLIIPALSCCARAYAVCGIEGCTAALGHIKRVHAKYNECTKPGNSEH